jgi:hypothetical protein
MSHPSVDPTADAAATILVRPVCLVAGCPCKDARIVSHRRAAFFASLSRSRGETADRLVEADPEWALPAPVALDDGSRVAP